MITSITLSDIASYKEATTLETDKRINLVYGLNGTGKTTICEYLKNLDDEDIPEFGGCAIEGYDCTQQKILVYNRKFIEDTFYESDTQKGIFTLAKENKTAIQNREKAEGQIKSLQDEHGIAVGNLKNKELEIGDLLNEIMNETWKIITEYTGGERVFDTAGFLDGLKGRREKLFNYICGIRLKENIDVSLDDIKSELINIGEGAHQRDVIQTINVDKFSQIEKDPIFKEEIIGSKNSSVAKLIDQLGNSDWVQKGLGYINDKSKTCPFCQEDTLTDVLINEIRDYFDEVYEKKIVKINELVKRYQILKDITDIKLYKQDYFTSSQASELESLFEKLNFTLDNNLSKIKDKEKFPSQRFDLASTEKIINKINDFINTRISENTSLNHKIKNRVRAIENLKKQFWQILRKEYDPAILGYHRRNAVLEREKKKINSVIKMIYDKINEQQKIILNAQKQTTNIDQTINAINNHLLDFGIQSFEIVKYNDESYRIKRDYEQMDNTNPVFKSLSEGEKTVISFLYFVELCKGMESIDETRKKIVVIDDPISSLSHMYVFNIAQLIKNTFFDDIKEGKSNGEYLQCFVLTHSLYFFHELVIWNSGTRKKFQKFFRITKSDSSEICEMEHSDIKNEYEEYWQIVQDATSKDTLSAANAMRNIIEHFFGFIGRVDGIGDIFDAEKLESNKFQAFKRYMNRESHSNMSSISNYKTFDIDIFKKAFQKVFEISGHKEHYEQYMNRGKNV